MSRLPNRVHRLGVVVALVALVVIGIVVSKPSTARRPVPIPDDVDQAQIGAATFGAPSAEDRDRAMPTASGLQAASTTWFCGGAPAGATTIVLTNRSDQVRTTVITAVAGGERSTRRVALLPLATQSVPVSFAGQGTVATIVESRHGGVVASQRIVEGKFATVAACSTASSDSWYFAGGDTQRGSAELLVLFNPFDELATADVTFLTPDGFRHPQATQGLAVPGRSVVVVDVAKAENRRSGLAAAVTTRAGKLIVWRHQSFDGTGPKIDGAQVPKGVSLALGSSTPLKRFALPTAVTGDGVAPRIILANPGASTSKVRLTFAVDNASVNGQPPATTIDLMPGGVQVLGPNQLRQVAAGVSFSVSGAVVSGGAVVSELWFDGAAPAKGHGAFATPAFAVAAKTWVFPEGLASPKLDQLGVQAAGGTSRLSVWVIRDGKRTRLSLGAQPVVVAEAGRVTIDLAALLKSSPGAAVEVDASSPVTVSRLQTGNNQRGLVTIPGVPVAGGLTSP